MGMSIINQKLINWLNQEPQTTAEIPLSDFERIRYELKPCDVLLIEGRSRVSSIIRVITASPWTHGALYLGRLHDIGDPTLRETITQQFPCEPDTQIVIESMLGKGTIVSPLSYYENDHLRICRPKGISYKDTQEVIRYAISRLGSEYDVRQIFDLARFLFPWILLPRRWRSTLFKQHLGPTTRTVCSTMIAEAFGYIQFPILPLVKRNTDNNDSNSIQLFRRNPRVCVPSDFDFSPYFEIIKYPFVDFNLSADYRLLPWNGSGTLSGAEAEMYLNQQPVEPLPTSHAADANTSPSHDTPSNDSAETSSTEGNYTFFSLFAGDRNQTPLDQPNTAITSQPINTNLNAGKDSDRENSGLHVGEDDTTRGVNDNTDDNINDNINSDLTEDHSKKNNSDNMQNKDTDIHNPVDSDTHNTPEELDQTPATETASETETAIEKAEEPVDPIQINASSEPSGKKTPTITAETSLDPIVESNNTSKDISKKIGNLFKRDKP